MSSRQFFYSKKKKKNTEGKGKEKEKKNQTTVLTDNESTDNARRVLQSTDSISEFRQKSISRTKLIEDLKRKLNEK